MGWITIAMIMIIDCDHLFDSTLLNAQFAHNFVFILYYFLNFDRTFIPPIYFSKKCVLFCKRHTSFIFPL